MGRNVAMPFGFFIGIYLDILTGKQIGISAIMYSVIGFLGGYFDKNFSKDSKITIILMVVGTTILFETVVYLYTIARNQIPIQLFGFVKILVFEVIFNILLTIILYPAIKSVGYYAENIFKKKKFLTRYF